MQKGGWGHKPTTSLHRLTLALSLGATILTPGHPTTDVLPRPGAGVHFWLSSMFFHPCEVPQNGVQVTLTCHGFQPHQEADQAREADPATAVTVPKGHEI